MKVFFLYIFVGSIFFSNYNSQSMESKKFTILTSAIPHVPQSPHYLNLNKITETIKNFPAGIVTEINPLINN